MRIGSRLLPLVVLALIACKAETNSTLYNEGDPGTATFRNTTQHTVYLGGCNTFVYEERVNKEWIGRGSDVVCFWEGLARPVGPGEAVVESITARNAGTWRLRYAVGIGCDPAKPLSLEHCRAIGNVYSNTFEVVALDGCVVSGCSSEICADQAYYSPCWYLPEFECLQFTICGHFGPEGSCGWAETPEYLACLENVSKSSP